MVDSNTWQMNFRVERCVVDQSYKWILNLAFMGAIIVTIHMT